MIQTIFATPIYKSDNLYNLSESELNVLNNLKMKPNRAGNEVSVEKEIFENHKQLSELKKWCMKHVSFFAEQLGVDKNCEVYITQSWLNINPPKKGHHTHMHPNSIFSAVFYVEGVNSPTYFYRYDDRSSFGNFTFYDKHKGNPFTANKVGVLNEPGRLILFPSSLVHDVDINKGNSNRKTISFNTFIKGEFGDYDELTKIKI